MNRIINFPEINWEKLHEGALSKELVWDELEKGVKFLLEVQRLKKTSFLAKDTIDKSKEVLRKMEELVEHYPQIRGVIQNIFGRQTKEMAAATGDSKTLFSRLEFLVSEATFYGSLAEWAETDLAKVPYRLKNDFEVRLYDPRSKQTRYFLPASWRNDTHKRTALVLRDLSFKARDTYKAEKSITKTEPQTSTQTFLPETPKAQAEPVKETKPKTPKPRKPKNETKPKKGAKAAIRTESRKDDDQAEIREAKKVGSLAEIGTLLKK